MDAEEFRRIREVFDQALLLPAVERKAFLDRVGNENAQIRAQVDSLLMARDRAPSWLSEPAIGASAAAAATCFATDLSGRRLSGYTLLREIGRGGMGRVYLAERSDGAFHKRAAVKLVLPSAVMGSEIERFEQERRILATLDHPNIARLIDAGVTEEGWPYFVMEYVEGLPIHAWCDDRKLNISQRIELYRQVLAAVRYAHQRLVVHRDLKPGNILVTNEGVVKLLDFGIAKVLTREATGEPDTVTLAQIMTPEYASPEQVGGSAITTLSDVYSLGVVLYELLTGHRPYRLFSAAMHEMARVIAEVEPSRPSLVVSTTESAAGRSSQPITPDSVSSVREGDPDRLRKRLAGDLDSILLMALRKEPERRYSSVESFSDDLERHLRKLPIAAREMTPWYRFRRLCARNPSGVAVSILLILSFLGNGAAVVMQARHDIEAAIVNPSHKVFLAPVLLFSYTMSVVAFAAFVYFLAPGRRKLIGAAVGGCVWSSGLVGRSWMERYLGWWNSRLPGNDDPLLLLTPTTAVLYVLLTTLILLILSAVGRRYSWPGQAIALGILALWQATREQFWYGVFIPALQFQSGVGPTLGSAAMIAAAGVAGLVAFRTFTAWPGGSPYLSDAYEDS